jgi:hypothetical protein
MTGQMQKFVERRKQLPLKHKLHLMAETLRNCNLKQGRYAFYEKDTKDQERFCAYGALGHMAGIPKDELKKHPYYEVLEKYGITDEDRKMLVNMKGSNWEKCYGSRIEPLTNAIYLMNDVEGKSYSEMADWLDSLQG